MERTFSPLWQKIQLFVSVGRRKEGGGRREEGGGRREEGGERREERGGRREGGRINL